jgi:hypothetical protein
MVAQLKKYGKIFEKAGYAVTSAVRRLFRAHAKI